MVLGSLLGFELPPLMLVAIALVVILVLRSWANTPANLPPMPARPFPILGHLVYMSADPRPLYMQWRKKMGDIFRVYFGSRLVIVLSSYDILKETLVKRADIFTSKPEGGFLPCLDIREGIILTSGPVWKENRSTVLSILRAFGMGKNLMAEKVTEEINYYMEQIEATKGEPTDMKDYTGRAISNIICNFVLGKRFEYHDEFYAQFLKMYNQATQQSAASSLQIWFPWVQYVPGDPCDIQKTLRDNDTMIKFAHEFMRQAEEETSAGVNSDNIIASYLKEMNAKVDRGQDTCLSKGNLFRVITDLLTAGSETATSTILWFYLYMIHNPETQKKVHEEIDAQIGSNKAPTIADKSKLIYVSAAIMETQRLASIVPLGLFHLCTEETTVRGYTIPKDTYIMPHLDAVLHSEEIWGDPQNFRPERFIDEKGNLKNPEEFVPFSMGRRLCLGEALARAELFLFITHVFQRYRVEAREPGTLPSLDSILGLTRAPVGFEVRFTERESS